MNFNEVTLVGRIATELSHRQSKRRAGQDPMSVVDFKLTTERQMGRRERMSIRVVVFGGAAETFLKHKKQGDYVLVSGRLCQATFEGREGGTIEHHYVVAERFQFLWGPPGKFIRGHVVVPSDEYARFKALEEAHGGPFHIPDDVVANLGADEPSDLAELQAFDPDDAEAVMERILQDQSKDTLDMPGAVSGSEGFDRRPGKKTARTRRRRRRKEPAG